MSFHYTFAIYFYIVALHLIHLQNISVSTTSKRCCTPRKDLCTTIRKNHYCMRLTAFNSQCPLVQSCSVAAGTLLDSPGPFSNTRKCGQCSEDSTGEGSCPAVHPFCVGQHGPGGHREVSQSCVLPCLGLDVRGMIFRCLWNRIQAAPHG